MIRFGIGIYIFTFALATMILTFKTWSGDFTFLSVILGEQKINKDVELAVSTVLGSLLGGSILSLSSFHKYNSNGNFSSLHSCGYLMAPLFFGTIGILMYVFLQSGIFILTGQGDASLNSSQLAYLAMGAIASYNWDIFIKKLEGLSSSLSGNK